MIDIPETAHKAAHYAPRPVTQMVIGGVIIPLLVVLLLGGFVLSMVLGASAELTVPSDELLLVHAAPHTDTPLVARFGANHTFKVIGRNEDWRWLKVEIWDGKQGWALRPLGIFVWQIKADIVPSQAVDAVANVPLLPEEMIPITGGRFPMGSPPGIGDADETPVRTVTLSPFEIGRTEVTVGHYWNCVKEGACAPPSADGMSAQPHYNNDPAFDNYPVVNVNWIEAHAYCEWRDQRLPTEAEWEMAAGWDAINGSRALWPWGNDQKLATVALRAAGLTNPAAVGFFADDVSPNGVHDMGGNVREWVVDWYKVNYYSEADNSDPRGPTARRGDGTGRVVRGGSFEDRLDFGRSANRHHSNPFYGRHTIGFRCAAN